MIQTHSRKFIIFYCEYFIFFLVLFVLQISSLVYNRKKEIE